MFSIESNPLDDPQQETACQKRAMGLSQEAAYHAAGYSDANNASRFFRQPHIRARVSKVKARRVLLADLDEGLVLTNLKALAKQGQVIGNANLDDFFAHNDKGERIGIELTDVPRKKMAALGEVTVEQYTEGPRDDPQTIKRTKIRLKGATDAIAANQLIGKYLGMWRDINITEVTGKDGGPIEVSDKDRARALAAFVARTTAEIKAKTPA